MPIAPCRFKAAVRSAADCMCAASGPGIDGGAPARYTTSFASNVQAGEVIVISLGNRQSMAGEHQLGLDRRGRIDPQADDRIGPERQGLGSAVR